MAVLLLVAVASHPRVPTLRSQQWEPVYWRSANSQVALFYLARGNEIEQPQEGNQVSRRLAESALEQYRFALEAEPARVPTRASVAILQDYLGQSEAARRTIADWPGRGPLPPPLRFLEGVITADVPPAGWLNDPQLSRLEAATPVGRLARIKLLIAFDHWSAVTAQWQQAAAGARPAERRFSAIGALSIGLVFPGLVLLVWVVWRRRFVFQNRRPAADWEVGGAVEVLLLWLFLSAVAGNFWPTRQDAPAIVLRYLFAGLGALAWFYAEVRRRGGLGWRRAGLWWQLPIGLAAVGSLLPILLGFEWVISRLFHMPPFRHPIIPVLVTESSGADIILLMLFACVVAPIVEESIFRGVIFSSLRRRLPLPAAAIFSAFIFAAAHLDLPSLLPLAAFAVLLAYLYEYSGSIVPAAIAHGVFNLYNLIALYLLLS